MEAIEITSELIEQLACQEHHQWAKWTKHFLDNMTDENMIRWKRQVKTPYACLTEEEKDKDRIWVMRMFLIMNKLGIKFTKNGEPFPTAEDIANS